MIVCISTSVLCIFKDYWGIVIYDCDPDGRQWIAICRSCENLKTFYTSLTT